MTTSSEQVRRLLTLVPYLQKAGEADLAATAELFGVTKKQLVTDLNTLWYCGLPGGLPGDLIEVDMDALDEGQIRLSNAEYLSAPMRFTPDEALSLIVALQAVGELAGPELGAAVTSAVAKLGGGQMDPRPAPVVVAGATGTPDVRQTLMDAIEAGEIVTLGYDGTPGTAPSVTEVEPARLGTVDGYAYLQAWSLRRSAWRTYRVDRISSVERTGRARGGHGEPEPLTGGWLDRRPEAVPVTVEVTASARWITEYYPIRAVRPTSRGVEVDLLVADPAWLRTLLLRLGGQVLRVDPPQAAESAAVAAWEALSCYDALDDEQPPD